MKTPIYRIRGTKKLPKQSGSSEVTIQVTVEPRVTVKAWLTEKKTKKKR